jgi:hypothetical protein
VKEHNKSYVLAGGCCVSFGIANYFCSDLSIRCGFIGIYTQCFGSFITWALFHIYKYIMFRKNSKTDQPYFRKSNSNYYEEFLVNLEEDDENNAADLNKHSENSLEIE